MYKIRNFSSITKISKRMLNQYNKNFLLISKK